LFANNKIIITVGQGKFSTEQFFPMDYIKKFPIHYFLCRKSKAAGKSLQENLINCIFSENFLESGYFLWGLTNVSLPAIATTILK